MHHIYYDPPAIHIFFQQVAVTFIVKMYGSQMTRTCMADIQRELGLTSPVKMDSLFMDQTQLNVTLVSGENI